MSTGMTIPGFMATARRPGVISAAMFRAQTGSAPTVDTSANSTAGASFTYSRATIVNVTSSQDPSITTIACRYSIDLGQKAACALLPVALVPGSNGDRTQYPDAMLDRLASKRATGRNVALLPIAVTPRGRGTLGNDDAGWFSNYDIRDAVRAAVAAAVSAGCTILGSGDSFAVVGISAGAQNAALMGCQFLDEIMAIVLVAPAVDLGEDSEDGYWALAGSRATLISRIGDRGYGSAAQVAPYMARNALRGLGRVMGLERGGPLVFVGGDRTEPPSVPEPGPDDVVAALQADNVARSRLFVRITEGETPHADAPNGTDCLAMEPGWARMLLEEAVEWSMPRISPPGGLVVCGHMQTRTITGSTNAYDDAPGWRVVLGDSTAPFTTTAGAKVYGATIDFNDVAQSYSVRTFTPTGGYVQVTRGNKDRVEAITAFVQKDVHLNVSPVLTSLVGRFAHDFRSDEGVTGTTTVTAWDEAEGFGALQFTAGGGSEPSLETDGNANDYLNFVATSTLVGQHMLLSSAAVDPREDFTIVLGLVKSDATGGQTVFDVAHNGTYAELPINWTPSSFYDVYHLDGISDTGAGQVGQNGATTGDFHVFVLMREGDKLHTMLDGSYLDSQDVTADTFTVNGSEKTALACALAGASNLLPYQHATVQIYEVAFDQSAKSTADLLGTTALLHATWNP